SAILPPLKVFLCYQTDQIGKGVTIGHRRGKCCTRSRCSDRRKNFQRNTPDSKPIKAEPAMIHKVSRLVKAMKAKLALAIKIETGPCRASRASGMVVDAIRPAAARVNECIAPRIAGRSARAPRYWSSGIMRKAGVTTASHPTHAPGIPPAKYPTLT